LTHLILVCVFSISYLMTVWVDWSQFITFKMYEYRAHMDSHKAINELQINMKCCGSDSFQDWF